MLIKRDQIHHLQSSLIRSVYAPAVNGNVALPGWWPHWLIRAYYRFLDIAFMDRLLAPETNRVRVEVGLLPIKSIFYLLGETAVPAKCREVASRVDVEQSSLKAHDVIEQVG